MNELKNRIQDTRKAKKINQSQIAKHLGISQAAYAKIESGKTSLSLDKLFLVADFLGVSIGFLLGDYTISNGNNDELEKLRKSETELKKRIAELEEMNVTLRSNRRSFVYSLISHIENDPYNSMYWIYKQGYQYAKTDEQKQQVDELIKKSEADRRGLYDYYINAGMITKEDIDMVQQNINELYKKQNFERTFKEIFSNSKVITGKPLDFDFMAKP